MRLRLEILFLDLKYALRRLAKNPAFTIVACLSLALGIGANTAAFSVLYAVMLRPLPVRDPGSLVLVSTKYTGSQYSTSHPVYSYLRDHAASVAGVVAFRALPMNVNAGNATDRVTGMLVSGNYFDVLGVPMAAGAPIRPIDDLTPRSGGPRGPVAVISHQFWTRRFNADPAIVGRLVKVSGHAVTIIGITAPAFRGTRVGSLPDVFVPMMFAAELFDDPNWLTNPRNNWLRVMGRLKTGVSLPQAQAEMTSAFRQFNTEFIVPLVTTDLARRRALGGVIILEPGRAGLLEMGSTVGPSLFVLMGLVSIVMLIACVNVANLLIARADTYHRDTAISIALGATRARLWFQHFVETLVLGTSGIVMGVILARWMRVLLVQLVPARQQVDVSMDANVLGLSTLLGIVAATLLATVATRQNVRPDVIGALKGTDAATRAWMRKGLIVVQLALSVVVLVAAALFGQTLNKLRLVDPGFERERVLIASVVPAGHTPEQRRMFYTRLLNEVREIPGVVAASLANDEPLEVSTGWNIQVSQRGIATPQSVSVPVVFVSDGYFRTMGIPFAQGRDLEPRDETTSLRVAIVNEAFARRYLNEADAVGTHVTGNGNMSFEIIGVVKDSAATGLRNLDAPVMYLSNPFSSLFGAASILHVRAAVPPATLTEAIEGVVRRLDPDVPVFGVRTMDQQLDRFMGRERTFARLSSVFGILALALSAVGLYGVLAHVVNRRTRELGIRLALGAGPGRLVGMVLRESGALVMLGIVAGLPCAYATARTIGSFLYGVEPGDWKSVAVAVTVLSIVALVSAWAPARRAARVDPLVALRSE